jgi:hypothetical protein
MFTIGTFFGAKLVGFYQNSQRRDVRLGINRITAYTVLYGLLVGLVTGTRLAGSFLLAFVVITHIVVGLGKKNVLKNFLPFWGLYGAMTVSWFTTVYALHPAAWNNPFRWLIEGFLYLSRYEWGGTNLFRGHIISGDVPRSYLPIWLVITTPVIMQILFIAGAIILFYKYLSRKLTPEQQACALLISLQIGFLPGIAILRDSTIYNGLRQFLFILPGVASIAAAGFAWILHRIQTSKIRLAVFVIFAFMVTPILVDMISLHPYEYVYFNRASGGLQKAHNHFDIDYWGLSMREAMEWINSSAEPNSRIVTSRHYISSEPYARSDMEIIRYHEYDVNTIIRPIYTLILDKYEAYLEPTFADCEIVYQVRRQSVPLTTVRLCE